MAANLSLKIDQSATFSSTVELEDENDTVIDLTGYTVRASMRKHYASSSATSFTTTIDSPATLGKVTIALTAVQTALLVPGRYVYDLEIEINSVVTRVLEGMITVTPSVTRETGVPTTDIYGTSLTP